MTTWTLPRESVELIGPISTTVDGQPVTDFEVALVSRSARPSTQDWTAPSTVEGQSSSWSARGLHARWTQAPTGCGCATQTRPRARSSTTSAPSLSPD